MELFLALQTITLPVFVDFFVWGLMMNVIGIVLAIVASLIGVAKMTREQIESFNHFAMERKKYILEFTTPSKQLMSKLSFIFPMHTFILGIVFSFNVLFRGPLTGMLKGVMIIDKIHMFPMIKYHLKDETE